MEKRSVKLNVCGVMCSLRTDESEEYMASLEAKVSDLMSNMLKSSPMMTIELAAVTSALMFCDEGNKLIDENARLKEDTNTVDPNLQSQNEGLQSANLDLQDRNERLKKQREELYVENLSLQDANGALTARNQELERSIEQGDVAQAADNSKEIELEIKNASLLSELQTLKEELEFAKVQQQAFEQGAPIPKVRKNSKGKFTNPMRYGEEYEQQGFVSFFANGEK